MRSREFNPGRKPFSVTLVGLGVVGSHVVSLLSRVRGVGHVTLIDPEQYDASNLGVQDILPHDVGKPKAVAQARRLKRLNPSVIVNPIVARLEDVPMGRIRSDVILAAVDSLSGRRSINTIAWRLDVPWIDVGLDGAGSMARVNVYRPSSTAPCIECGWSGAIYSQMDQQTPCQLLAGVRDQRPGSGSSLPTGGSASLGALAAALQVGEAEKILTGEVVHSLADAEVFLDTRHHRFYHTRYRRSQECRFDHRTWEIEILDRTPKSLTFDDLVALIDGRSTEPTSVSVPGRRFMERFACRDCGLELADLEIVGPSSKSRRDCTRCGGAMFGLGFFSRERLDLGALKASDQVRSLASAGFRSREVFRLDVPEGERYFELS